MVKILDPQYGNDFVGRGEKIAELKEKIKDRGFVIVTGDRGIGKTNLTLVVEEALNKEKAGFLKKKLCYHVNGSFFYEEVNRIFAPSKRLTGVSGSVSVPIAGAGGGLSWNPREPFILEYMGKSKEKIVFVENAHELKKEDFEIIFDATRRNDRLRFVLEIATPYLPDVTIRPGSYEVVKLPELSEDAIEQIVRKECPLFSDTIVLRIVSLSKGYSYVARSLAYICDNKDSEEEIAQFLKTLRDDDMGHNLNKIHGEVLATLGADSQAVIKRLAVAPDILTLNLIAAFCGDDVDHLLTDLSERGILVTSEENIYRLYHPLFREYLRSIQPVALKTKQGIYSEALEKVKTEFDSIYLLFEVLDAPFFASLLKQAENYEVINSIGNQACIWGKLDPAFSAWMHLLELTKDKDKAWESIATGNIGNVYQIKGDLGKALGYHEKSLKLEEELGSKEGMANQYGNIGNIYRTKGDLGKALGYHEKSLKLNEDLGRKEGMAIDYGNMGIVYGIKGELDTALKYFGESLKLEEKLSRKAGVASDYGNMGIVYRTKGDLDKALKYHMKSLKLEKELGWKEGMASNYGNMGTIYRIKGDFDKALEYHTKSLELEKELGHKEGVASDYGNIGIIYELKGDFDKALEYYGKSLKLFEELGSKEGMANQYGNIGGVYKTKSDFGKALEYYGEALELFKGIESRLGTAQTLLLIGDVFMQQGDKECALEHYREAKPLAEGSSVFEEVSKRLEELEEENREQ